MHAIAGKAVSFKEAMSDDFKVYQQEVVLNAQAMAKTFIEWGIKIVSGGTHNHLMLVDLIGKEYTGTDADAALGANTLLSTRMQYPMIRAHRLLLAVYVLVHLLLLLVALNSQRIELTH